MRIGSSRSMYGAARCLQQILMMRAMWGQAGGGRMNVKRLGRENRQEARRAKTKSGFKGGCWCRHQGQAELRCLCPRW